MGRRARLRIAGVPWHVIQRGNNRADCFAGDSDRLVYLSLLETESRGAECAIHAYALMDNHVHLLLTPEEADGPSRMMKRLGQQYVQYFNRTHTRTGTLWEGRFRSCIVDTEHYLLTCHRYIEANPVRAGMVASAGAFPWSSYRANAWGRESSLVTPHASFLALADTAERRQEAYVRLFEQEQSREELQAVRDAVNGGFALGSDAFIDRIQGLAAQRPATRRRKPTPTGCGLGRNEAD